jgi:chromosomal replication initiator protein
MKKMISAETTEHLSVAFARRIGEPVQLELLSDPEEDEDDASDVNLDASAVLSQLRHNRDTLEGSAESTTQSGIRNLQADSVRLNPRYTFEQFVVGKHNQLAHAAAQAVAERPGVEYNPLFVYSLTGLGKTHLLHAIGHEVVRIRPEARVKYVTTEEFTNQLIKAIQHRDVPAFNRIYRSADLLLVDDIQFLINKDQTQENFFHLFNTLHELGRQVVITSDRMPSDLDTLEDRLISRFESGLTADISKPDYETRLAILHQKNQSRGFGLSSDILARIASVVDSNVRELEGALTKVSALGRLSRLPLTQDEVDDVLDNMRKSLKEGHAPSADDILEEAAIHFQISVEDLKSDRRTARVSVPRQIGMYFCRELTHLSLKDIGQVFGGKDHTTVIYALERVEARLGVDESFAREVMLLRNRLRERFRAPESKGG